jgi:hemerythrin-like domain-containing protein
MPSSKTHPDRLRRSPIPGAETMEVLDRTHREILAMLARLQQLVDQLEAGGIDEGTRRLARDLCAFFEQTARPHHAAEEELVFPDLLVRGDAELVQHVRRLQQDHGWLEEDWRELAPLLGAVAHGQSWYDIDLLRSYVSKDDLERLAVNEDARTGIYHNVPERLKAGTVTPPSSRAQQRASDEKRKDKIELW